PVGVVMASLFTMVGGVAVSSPPTTTLALERYPHIAGTASSLLGMARFPIGGIAAPLVGIAGAATMLPLGIVTVVAVALAAASAGLLRMPRPASPAEPAEPAAPD